MYETHFIEGHSMSTFSSTFIHRQTTANAIRFTTIELSEIETKILKRIQ